MQDPTQSISFNQFIGGDEDTSHVSITRTVDGTRGESLTNLLAEFRYFLNAIGFTYIHEIIAVTDCGNEFSSND
jgi:hypothetical protein